MAIPFAFPRDEHPGMDLEQQLVRLLAIVSEIRMLLRLNTNNARDDNAASRRISHQRSARSPIISLSLDAGRVEMLVGATPAGATTVTTVTTTTTTTTTTNRNGDRDANNEHHQPGHDIGSAAGAPRYDATADAKRMAASLREMAEKLQSLQSTAADEIVDDCGVDENNDGDGSDVPDSRPINPSASVPPPPRAATPPPSTSTSSSSSRSTVTTVTTFTTTRHTQPAENNGSTGSVLDKLSSAPSVSMVVVPFAVMVVWQWLRGR